MINKYKISFWTILISTTLSVIVLGCLDKNNGESGCYSISGIDTFLIPGQIILLGEIHGTKEGPRFEIKLYAMPSIKT